MPSGYIWIHNDKKYIRVTNKNTNVISYMNKTNLVVQQDNANSFLMKNDSYVKYFKYNEVSQPTSDNLGELLQIIIGMIQTEETSQLIVINEMKRSDVVIDYTMYSDKQDNKFNELEPEPGDIEYDADNNYVTLSAKRVPSSPDPKTIIRQTKEYVHIPSGKINISLLSGQLMHDTASSLPSTTSDTDHTITARIGLFDINNGVFFQYVIDNNGPVLSVVMRKNQSDTVIQQNQWNTDEINGLGPSGVEFNIDHMQTFVFRFGVYPKSTIQLGIIHNGFAVIVHEFLDETGFNGFTKLPLRWELQEYNNTGSTIDNSTIQLIQGNGVVLSNEKFFENKRLMNTLCPNIDYQYYLATTHFKEINAEIPSDVIFDMTLHPDYLHTKIKLTKIIIMNKYIEASMGLWRLVLNGEIYEVDGFDGQSFVTTSQLTPTDTNYRQVSKIKVLSKETSQSYDDTSSKVLEGYTLCKNGTTVVYGYIHSSGITEIDLTPHNVLLFSRLDGTTADNISLVVEYINTPLEVQASVSWEEYE